MFQLNNVITDQLNVTETEPTTYAWLKPMLQRNHKYIGIKQS